MQYYKRLGAPTAMPLSLMLVFDEVDGHQRNGK
jgi:hypothetical protein